MGETDRVDGDADDVLSAAEERVLLACAQQPAGVTTADLQRANPQLTAEKCVAAVNSLLTRGKLDLLKQGDQLIYRLKTAAEKSTAAAAKLRIGDTEEKVVYGIIEDAGDRGIWIRDIRAKSNLGMQQLSRLLRAMEGRRLIKSVVSVAASRKKVYMLYDLQPHQSVTGGAWYSDQDFESEFVDVLNEQCYKFLQQRAAAAPPGDDAGDGPLAVRQRSFVSSTDVADFITQLGISRVSLSVADIDNILDTLVYDGKAEKCVQSALSDGSSGDGSAREQQKLYRATVPLLPPSGLVRTPCGICPIADKCALIGDVTPYKCVYMDQWLK